MMIDLDQQIQTIAARHMAALFQPVQPVPAPAVAPIVQASAPITDTRFAAMGSAGKFAALLDGGEAQAAAGMFGRMCATAGIGCDEPAGRIGDIMLAGLRRELSQMWQFMFESAQTTPDEFDAAEMDLLREVLAVCLADHASRSDRRAEFFGSIAGVQFGDEVLSQEAVKWLLCR